MAYQIKDLGRLGGDASIAYAVNQHGQAAGEATTGGGGAVPHAFFWSPTSGVRDLGTLGGSRSVARGINAWGEVVGQADLPDDTRHHGFVWSASTGMLDLQPLPGDTHSWANAIDDSGRIVGASGRRNGRVQAVLWNSPTSPDPLGALGTKDSEACGISASGLVVGFSNPMALQGEHAFLRDTSGSMRDLGTFGGRSSRARAIGPGGAVVGSADDGAGRQRPFRWVAGVLFDLGMDRTSIEGVASGINTAGDVVGSEKMPGLGRTKAILHRAGKTYDLDEIAGLDGGPAWSLERANAINDAGQIVGQGLRDGVARAFLLTPA